jgi:hypothetical protein
MKKPPSRNEGRFFRFLPRQAAAAPEARLDIFPQADTINPSKAGKSVLGMQP